MADDITKDPEGPDAAAGGGPDKDAQIQRLKSELADAKQQLADERAARKSLDERLAKALTEDDVKAAVEKAQAEAKKASDEAEAAWLEREKRLTVENALVGAGCIDARAAIAHVDLSKVEIASDGHVSGLDVKGLSESRPYLFRPANTATVASAAGPAGPGKKMSRGEIAEVKDPAERRRLIAENVNLAEA